MSRRNALQITVAVLCSMQLALPALAETTVLKGAVTRNALGAYGGTNQTLTPQTPKIDTSRPTYAGSAMTTHVAPPPRPPLYGSANRTGRAKPPGSYWSRHPKIKSAAIGAGVGTAAGAVTGLVTGRGVVRGAAIGAGAGAGVGLLRSSHTMRRHPILNDVATGSVVGLGLGLAGGRHHGTAARATAVGAAVGLGVGLFKNLK